MLLVRLLTNFKCNIKGSPAPGGVAGTWLSKYSIDALTGTSARQGGEVDRQRQLRLASLACDVTIGD